MFDKLNDADKPNTSFIKHSVEFNEFTEPQRLHPRPYLRLLSRPLIYMTYVKRSVDRLRGCG